MYPRIRAGGDRNTELALGRVATTDAVLEISQRDFVVTSASLHQRESAGDGDSRYYNRNAYDSVDATRLNPARTSTTSYCQKARRRSVDPAARWVCEFVSFGGVILCNHKVAKKIPEKATSHSIQGLKPRITITRGYIQTLDRELRSSRRQTRLRARTIALLTHGMVSCAKKKIP